MKRRSTLLVLTGFALLMTGLLAPGAQARISGFQALTPSPVPLTAVAADPGTGLVYAQENRGTSFFVYDPRTNAWTEKAEAPIDSGNNGGAAFLNGKIYITYTHNKEEMSVYDIATDSWTTIENPLEEEGTAAITAGNGKLYLTVEREFFEYDPATGTSKELAEPPDFAPENCHEGFEPWGGLQFDGTKIYGHQGDGCSSFAVYDIAGNSWQELPLIPEGEGEEGETGAVAGSALNPVTNTYLTYGPYEGETLYRFDLEAGSWSTSKLPFEVDDGGMAYINLLGFEGVYMIQGEEGTEFTRYTEKNEADLSAAMSASVVGSTKGGEITYSVQVKNNGPERASGVTLSDPLPAGASLISAGASQGSCAGTTALTCSLGVLTGGASATLTIKLKTGFGTVTNTVTATSQAEDSNHGNDSASVVSSVPRPCVVPKLKKLPLKKAKKALRKAHCKPGKVKHRHSGKIKKGRVISGGKKRGAVLPTGKKVKLVVSSGPKHKPAGKPTAKH